MTVPLRKEVNISFSPATRQDDLYEIKVILSETKSRFRIIAMLQSMTIGQTVYYGIFEDETREGALADYDAIVSKLLALRSSYEYNEIPSNKLQQAVRKELDSLSDGER